MWQVVQGKIEHTIWEDGSLLGIVVNWLEFLFYWHVNNPCLTPGIKLIIHFLVLLCRFNFRFLCAKDGVEGYWRLLSPLICLGMVFSRTLDIVENNEMSWKGDVRVGGLLGWK